MTEAEDWLAAVVFCRGCGKPMADVARVPVTDEDGASFFELEARWRRRMDDARKVVELNRGVRRLVRCACPDQPCTKPEHIFTGDPPRGDRVDPYTTDTAWLANLHTDKLDAWCDRDGVQTVNLAEIRSRVESSPTGSTVRLRTVSPSTRRSW